MKTPKKREAERMELLRQIRDGEKHTKANRVLAPLGQAALIEVTYKANGWQVDSVKLTPWGEVVLRNWEERTR